MSQARVMLTHVTPGTAHELLQVRALLNTPSPGGDQMIYSLSLFQNLGRNSNAIQDCFKGVTFYRGRITKGIRWGDMELIKIGAKH